MDMNAIPYEDREEGWDDYGDDELDDDIPGRPRRNLFNRWSALLFALILGGIGFYVGIRVEKNQLASSSSTGAAGAFSRFAALRGSSSGATSGARASLFGSGSGRSGGFAGAGGGGLAAAFGGGDATIGTVSSVNGSTLYVTSTSGNTVKVVLSGSTKITKSETVGQSQVYPGDSLVIEGVKGSNGTVTATSVTDSGARAGSTGTGSGSTSGSSAVSSLFGGG
jgi:hypothetical protein